MKNIKLAITITVMSFFGIVACSESNTVEPVDNQPISSQLSKETIFEIAAEDISESESASLSFMREEEKLARDIYIKFYQKFGLRVFDNISKSEQTHTDAIKYLIEKYELNDPVQSDEIGVFKNLDLQILYNKLYEQSILTEIDALKVGALIEEVDILDLVKSLNEDVDNKDITLVYSNLKNGSENHLRAFVKNLSAKGINYIPQLLDIDTFNTITNR